MTGIIAAVLFSTAFLDLHPAPQSALIQQKGLFPLENNLPLVVDDNATREDLDIVEPLFEALGFKLKAFPASTFKAGDRALYLGVAGKNSAFNHRSLKQYVPDPAEAGGEAYALTIWRNGIVVAGTDRAGVIHGLQTLIQVIRESRNLQLNHRGVPAIPFSEIQDRPDVSVRGAYVKGPLTRAQLHAFAALKCNLLVFESDDFYDLNEERLALWRSIFQDARKVGIAPVPVFQFFNVPAALLAKSPVAVEGRSRIDRLSLPAEDWVALTRRNVILTTENPLRVNLNNLPLRFRQDYLISEGSLEPPFNTEYAHPWMIRGIPGSSVPENASVEAVYSFAPPGSNALCPSAPETRVLLRNTLEALLLGLTPEYIHCGFGDVGRINQDLRCRETGKSSSELYTAALNLIQSIVTDIKSGTSMILWADGLLPPDPGMEADKTSLHPALDTLPGNPMLFARFSADAFAAGGKAEKIFQWMIRKELPLFAAFSAGAPQSRRALKTLKRFDGTRTGVMVLDANPQEMGTKIALESAWSPASAFLPWPEVLNDFFESDLWEPDFEEEKTAVIGYVERQMLSGISPETLRKNFDQHTASVRKTKQGDAQALEHVAALFKIIIRLMELEYEYVSGNERSALSDLENLVEQYGEIDSSIDQERLERILATVKGQALFVPPSILLGQPLAYYRPFQVPAGAIPCEAPVKVEYADAAGSTRATLDFLVSCGPLFRVDFETVNAQSVTLEGSDDGVTYAPVAVSPTLGGGTLRGPLILSSAIARRFLRLNVESRGEQAVLREVRAFVLKQSLEARCPLISEADKASGKAGSGRHIGMLYADNRRLATAPTEIRLCRDSKSLILNFIARDPMPHAMSAALTATDAPLWEEESIELRVRPASSPARRFLVNPLGARYDAMTVAANLENWDAGWDGEWSVVAEKTESGWNARVVIPFAILGGPPKKGDRWEMNFLRHRNNVEKERSAWIETDGGDASSYGEVLFE